MTRFTRLAAPLAAAFVALTPALAAAQSDYPQYSKRTRGDPAA